MYFFVPDRKEMGVFGSKAEGSYVHWVIILDGPLDPSDDGRTVKRYLRLPNGDLEVATQRSFQPFVCHTELKTQSLTHLDLEKVARKLIREEPDLIGLDWCSLLFDQAQDVATEPGDTILRMGTVRSYSPDTTCPDPGSF